MSENNSGLILDDINYTESAGKKVSKINVEAPVLDDFGYTASTSRKGDPTGVSAPVLDDMADYAPHESGRRGMPTGVSAPVLDDNSVPYKAEKPVVEYMTDEELLQKLPPGQIETFNNLPEASKKKVFEQMRKQLGVEAPPEPAEEIKAPVLEDISTEYVSKARKGAPVLDETLYEDEPEITYMTDEEVIEKFTPAQLETYNNLPAENKQKVLDLMRKQLGVEAPPQKTTETTETTEIPVTDYEDTQATTATDYQAEQPQEPKKETPVSAPVLDDEPEPPKYQPKFVDEDLERAKREGARQAISSQLVSDQKDPKESLRLMLELKQERLREQAKEGFKRVILLAVVGLIGAVAFYLLYSGSLGLDYKDGIDGIAGVLKDISLYVTIAMGGTALAIVTGVGFFKSLASFVFLIAGIAQIFPGSVMIPQHEGSMGLTVVLYLVSLVCTIAVFVGLSAIESVSLYFKRNEL